MESVTTLLDQWYWHGIQATTLFNHTMIISSLLLIFFSVLFYKLNTTTAPKLNLPPSPPKLPIIGNIHQLGTHLHRSLQGLSDKYGPLILIYMGSNSPTLIVSSPEIAREIMKSHDSVFQNRPQVMAADVLFYGCSDVAFSPYGEYWRQMKKICVLELLSLRRVQAFQFLREEEVALMVEEIRRGCKEDGADHVLDLGEMFTTLSNNIGSRSALGRKYEDGNNVSFGDLSKKAMELMGTFNFGDFFPYLRWIDVVTGYNAKVRNTAKAFHALLDQVIDEHQQQSSTDQSDKKDLVDILLQIQKEGQLGINLTRENLKAILLDMFIGGTDTTATTMEWAMAELVKNPSKMKMVQEEVRRVVGNKREVDEADIDQMMYLKCIVKETLRLHAPVMVTRKSWSSVNSKLEGYDIPPKTKVLINAWAIQRDPKLWERPEVFVPERFMNNQVDFKGHHKQFIPFGAGRRGCPGMTFAVVEAEYVLACLLYWFDWRLPPGEKVEDFDMTDVFKPIIRKRMPLRLVPVLHSTC
ncbi:hypothetical protein FNV43_RR19504 [Rhamnella rubrinervis]|uniref:Cytochrome P450 71A1 n=1 Tax=Rhamnella rubrinervis TaxID=2594499 RepID=A0A8K0GTR4_9ROSA|nr:hypothetical protein FNV43_RR19504 [Rhamnella rubrinervis]